MRPIKAPVDMNSRTSASATDADDSLQGQAAAQQESDRIDEWTRPGPGRHELSKDKSYAGYRRRK